MIESNTFQYPSLTLVIPAYNRASLITETIDSALNQSQAFAQIIVVDDGSTDNTAQVLATFGTKIHVIKTPNQGVQSARNIGIAAAQTDYVALCDSDDLLEPNFVAQTSNWLVKQPETQILFCNFVTFNSLCTFPDKFSLAPNNFFEGAKRLENFYFDIPNLYERTIHYQPLFQSGQILQKTFFEALNGYDVRFRNVGAEDWEFTLRAIAAGRTALCATPLVRVRKHAGNDSLDSLRMTLGEIQILRYALVNHATAEKSRSVIAKSISKRCLSAFDGAYANGDFKLVRELFGQLLPKQKDIKLRAKHWISHFPDPIRNLLWSSSQAVAGTKPAKQSPPSIVVIEPTWDGIVHLPGNLGVLRIMHEAYPDALLSFVGGAQQIAAMKPLAPSEILKQTQFIAWEPNYNKDPLPSDVWAAMKRFKGLPEGTIERADLLVLSSCTSTALTALSWMGMAKRTCAILHGNASELSGWRSRNPLRRVLDLKGALKRFTKLGGHALVIEDRIQESMLAQHSWLKGRLTCLPHPLLPEESATAGTSKELGYPIHIGFAGGASVAKGFVEFLQIANELTRLHPGKFDFQAIGPLPKESAGLDQSVLSVPAAGGLPRVEFVEALRKLHYIFVWHKDEYYGTAASGVVYDAVNLGIPMIARNRSQIADWNTQGIDVALSFESVKEAVNFMSTYKLEDQANRYRTQCAALDSIRDSLSLPALGAIFVQQFPLSQRNYK